MAATSVFPSTAANPGGSDTQIQFNNNGVFSGDSGLTFNAGIGQFTVDVSNQVLLQCFGTGGGQVPIVSLVGPVDPVDGYTNVFGAMIFNGFSGSNTGIRTSVSGNGVLEFCAFDNDGASYKVFLTLTNADTPDLTIAPPSGGSVTLQASTYKSSDGSSGVDTTITTAGLVGKTITVKNGLITGFA